MQLNVFSTKRAIFRSFLKPFPNAFSMKGMSTYQLYLPTAFSQLARANNTFSNIFQISYFPQNTTHFCDDLCSRHDLYRKISVERTVKTND